jgi:hypothetical protein
MQKQALLQTQAQVRDAGVINAFCYPYARLLLNRAMTLKESGKLFKGDVPSNGKSGEVTTIGACVLGALHGQFPQISIEDISFLSSEELVELFSTAKDFLATFEDY